MFLLFKAASAERLTLASYHGKKSFDTFSHEKSVLKKSTRIDMPVRYLPYTPLKDRLLRIFLR